MLTDKDQNGSPAPAASSEGSPGSHSIESANPATASASGPASAPTLISEPNEFTGSTLDGRYVIEKQLDQGGLGVVYLARDRKLLDKPVVVKILLDKSLRLERIVQKFQQEKEALTRVDHPGIVGILDSGELADGKPYIVMQFIDGVRLRDVLRPEGMDLERALNIIKQTCEALAAAHAKGIFHRDLKPENIMLQVLSGGREQVKIIDFGIAKVKDSLVANSTVIPTRAGTYCYMSPEQFRAERVTAASDVYSLGVVAYEMVTGRRPFNADSVGQLGELLREGVRIKPKDLRPSLPVAAQNVILRALSLSPEARYQDACHFSEALERAFTDDPMLVQEDFEAGVSTQPLPNTTKLGGIPKRPAAIAVAVVAILLIGVAAILFSNPFVGSSNVPGSTAGNLAVPATERSFTYWLTVQKMRDGKPYQDPFESSGQEIFENGYGFRLNFTSPQSGYLYVFNEGATEHGDISFNLINKGSTMIGGNQVVQTNWNWFGGLPGREQLWIVWSASPVKEMEAARDAALKANGKVTDAGLLTPARAFLMKHSAVKPETSKELGNEQTMVQGKGDPLVKLIELVHR